MSIGSSPFLTADVDEPLNFNAHWPPELGGQMSGEIGSARLELIRRRVLTGYYASSAIAHELARRLIDRDLASP
jgi:hypothetical protein